MGIDVVCWALIVVPALLGVLGLVYPPGARRLVSLFVSKTPLRLFGLVLMAAGACVFRVGYKADLFIAVPAAGVFLFMAGGVQLIIPTVALVLNGWWVERSNTWHRLAGVAYLLAAGLYTWVAHTAGLLTFVSHPGSSPAP